MGGCISKEQIEQLKKKAEERQKLQKCWTDLVIKDEADEKKREYMYVKDIMLLCKMLQEDSFDAGKWKKMKEGLEKEVAIPPAAPAAIKARYEAGVPEGGCNDLQWNSAVQPDQDFVDAVVQYHDDNDKDFVAIKVSLFVIKVLNEDKDFDGEKNLVSPKDLKAACDGPLSIKDTDSAVDKADKNDDGMINLKEWAPKLKERDEDCYKLMQLQLEKKDLIKKSE